MSVLLSVSSAYYTVQHYCRLTLPIVPCSVTVLGLTIIFYSIIVNYDCHLYISYYCLLELPGVHFSINVH